MFDCVVASAASAAAATENDSIASVLCVHVFDCGVYAIQIQFPDDSFLLHSANISCYMH